MTFNPFPSPPSTFCKHATLISFRARSILYGGMRTHLDWNPRTIKEDMSSTRSVRIRSFDNLCFDLIGSRNQHHRQSLWSRSYSSHEVIRKIPAAQHKTHRRSAFVSKSCGKRGETYLVIHFYSMGIRFSYVDSGRRKKQRKFTTHL